MGACGAPRVCGDDPLLKIMVSYACPVLPAYAGMIPRASTRTTGGFRCSPRMRG